ncbi:MAG TPA: aldehyde dehydrogenase family protein [Candidatus Ozemobacteraceae bacterium]|nr:aldehyde dehydrogenase family protein [Candidatus Ozemobacteraceae bacterium]
MNDILTHFGLTGTLPGGFHGSWLGCGKPLKVTSPVNDQTLATVETVSRESYETIVAAAARAFIEWRQLPAPRRGEIVRQLGEALRRDKEMLGKLVSLEMGKPVQEGLGEVQEMIDICDYAVGLSRMFAGQVFPSERAQHRIMEQWHPLGVIGVISAFNFPVAVWSWNAALALVCGNTVLWKPSSKTPLAAIAVTKLAAQVLIANGVHPAVCSLVVGRGAEIGDAINTDTRVPLVSYTGSVSGGRHVGTLVQQRFGRLILELGGNNAVIVSRHADLDLALKAVYFGAVGTAGQRCTSTRRVIVHESVYDSFVSRLSELYANAVVDSPFTPGIHHGPLVDKAALETMMKAIDTIKQQGGRVRVGGEPIPRLGACYVTPCLVEAPSTLPMIQEETFAPILYCLKYQSFEEAIALQNGVPQGLSSAIITRDQREAELFVSATGSDCGLANVNTGTSGAEIGGAFGGEKETGGGRESGSDSWKVYMRRQTTVVNFSGDLTLAQGLRFELPKAK